MQHIQNKQTSNGLIGVYQDKAGNVIAGPALMPKPFFDCSKEMTAIEQCNVGLLTQTELGILGRPVAHVENLQQGKIQ